MSHEKYIRQIALPQVGHSGQQKLGHSRVLVVGAGGLGNAVLPYLASAGIGSIGVIDGDRVSLSNLHRQVLFSESDIGELKAAVACEKIAKQFPEAMLTHYSEFLTGENALKLFAQYDIILDATDAIDIRYLINDACIVTGKSFVHASVYRFQFQVALFNANNSGTYRCLYPTAPKTTQSCEEAGVMPSTVAMAGLYEVNEVFKYLLDIGKSQINSLLLVDTLSNEQNNFSFERKNQDHITRVFFEKEYQIIEQLAFANTEKDGYFLDVRELDEQPKIALENYVQIPLSALEKSLELVPTNNPIYLFCQSGKRSKTAYRILQGKGYTKLFCLTENAIEINKITFEIIE
jgi:adenylyltransferase/sulfurtransferase